MALTKVTYEDGVTVIHAANLNDIQDNVIQNASDIATNTENIATNTEGIATNAANISANTSNISTLSIDVDYLKDSGDKETGKNLVNPADFVANKFVNYSTGDFGSDTSGYGFASGYIDLTGITEIVYSQFCATGSSTTSGLAFYDESKTYISGIKSLTSQPNRAYVQRFAQVPANAVYAALTIRTDVGSAYLYDAKEFASSTYNKVSASTSESKFNVSGDDVLLKYITTSGTIAVTPADTKRLLVIPLDGIYSLHITITQESTKRYGLCNSLEARTALTGYTQVTGTLDATVENIGYKFLIVQLFTDSDTTQSYPAYLASTTITVTANTDAVARREIAQSGNNVFFHVENLKGLPILDSFSDIAIDTNAYANCAAFHTLMGTLCSSSNGYITQTLLGEDGHGNSLYKYVTSPKTLKYDVERGEMNPYIPVRGGVTIEPLTVLITSNIHGRERNGNWVVYNLLSKLLTADTDMLRFFKNRVRLVCVPYICASGEYKNADGININRDFPTTVDGTCVSAEATLVKSVIDEYGPSIFTHIDIHTFQNDASYANSVSGWIFTDSAKLGEHSVVAAEYVLDKYAAKYPTLPRFGFDYYGSNNIPTTCTYYTQTVYGAPSATIEGVNQMNGSPSGSDEHTSAVSYLYDFITQTIASMVD